MIIIIIFKEKQLIEEQNIQEQIINMNNKILDKEYKILKLKRVILLMSYRISYAKNT